MDKVNKDKPGIFKVIKVKENNPQGKTIKSRKKMQRELRDLKTPLKVEKANPVVDTPI